MAILMPTCTGLVGLKSENVKISSASVRPKWAYKQQTHIFTIHFAFPKKALARQEREPKQQRGDRTEKRSSKEALSDPFRRRKSELFGSKCFVLILGIVLPASAGSTFLKTCGSRSELEHKMSPKMHAIEHIMAKRASKEGP